MSVKEQLIRKEAKMGGRLFGSLEQGREREFFCLDKHTWVWRESWIADNGARHTVTTRYNVQDDGVIKLQDGHAKQRLSREEMRNLYHSIKLYRERVIAYYRRQLQAI